MQRLYIVISCPLKILLLLFCFLDPAGSEVKFDARGDGLARYTIMNYRRLPNSANSGYDYKVIFELTKKKNLFF